MSRALNTGFIEGDGKYYPQPRTEIRPRPQHSFDGRIYAVAASDESVLSAAKLGAHIIMFADRPWEMRMPGIERGRALHREFHGTEPPALMLSEFVVCGTDLEQCEAEARQYQGKFVESNFYHYEFLGDHFRTVQGYDAYQQKAEIARSAGLEGAVEGFMKAASWGTPDKILRGLEERREILGDFELNVAFRFGGVPYAIGGAGPETLCQRSPARAEVLVDCQDELRRIPRANELHGWPMNESNNPNSIPWREWNESAFADARSEEKPVLLTLGATWCHWCHVMDETSYSDERVIELVKSRFIPVRVDVDRRPDISLRYNQGGFPSVAFLTGTGEFLGGRPYTPPDEMVALLERISSGEVAAGARHATLPVSSTGEKPNASVDAVIARLTDLYDEEYGGFGLEPKQPPWEALRFLAARHGITGDRPSLSMVETTLQGMWHGIYDRKDQGFFRYSVSRDWKVPHYEKDAGQQRQPRSGLLGGIPNHRQEDV